MCGPTHAEVDPNVRKWLEDADLPELCDVFEREKLTTFRRILSLGPEHLKELIPQIGLRAHLSRCLSELQQSDQVKCVSPSPSPSNVELGHDQNSADDGNTPSNKKSVPVTDDVLITPPTNPRKRKHKGDSDSSDGSPTIKHIATSKSLRTLQSQNLCDIFKENIITENVLMKYESTGLLTEFDRGHIVERAVQYLLHLNPRPGLAEQSLLAVKICDVFKFETVETYFVAPNDSCKNATSKIPNKIRNIRYILKKRMDGASLKYDYSAHSNKTELTKPAELEGSCDLEDEQIVSAQLALKHQTTDSWPELLGHWHVTHCLRRQQLFEEIEGDDCDSGPQYLQTDEYYKKYPILQEPNGYMLLCQDFAELYPGRENCLLALWENYRPLIISLLEEETPKQDTVTRELLSALNKVKEDEKDALVLALLPNLCVKKGRGNSQKNTLPIPAVRKSFILHVKVAGDISREVRNYCTSLKQQNLKFQPILIAVGPSLSKITAWCVQIEETRYNFKTGLAALDTCLKAFFALDIGYPSASYGVWLFIQQCFFKISLQKDKSDHRVTSVISTLKSMMHCKK